MRKRRRRFILLLILYLLTMSAKGAFALGSVETKTVRVGFYYAEGFHVMDESGSRSGYAYEVLQAMKLYNNWAYEYIGYDKGWADIQQMMLEGEVDLVVSAIKTPARMEVYDFSDRTVGQSGAALMVKAGDSPYVAGKYEGYNGMRVGFIENSSQIASMEAFAREKGFVYTPVYYKTSVELENAIHAGTEIDALVTSNMRIIYGTRRLEMFDMKDIYAMVPKGEYELLRQVNYALEQISLYNPGLYNSLYNKYYSVNAGDNVFFSPEESEFIKQFQQSGDKLLVTLVPDISPYAYYDDGKPSGILYDIASEILRRTGLESQFVPIQNDAEYRALVEQRGVDLRLAARFDYNYAEKLGYTLIDPYYSTDVSRVTRKDHDGDIETVAVVRNNPIDTHYLPTIIQNERILRFGTVGECVEAVLNGECDALYLLTRTAQEAVFSDETNRLTSVIMPRFTVSFSIGVRDNADSRLASILEKSAASMSDNDVGQLVLKYTDYDVKPLTLMGILYSNPLIFIAIVSLFLILAFAGVLIAFIASKRKAEAQRNIQLQNALGSAERANSAKSVFMSRMSHEIRTPLNAIIGYNLISSDMLSQARSEQEYKKAAMRVMGCLSKSDVASKHLLTVINDVLDMSAIESGKMKIAHEPFDFKNAISALTIMFFSQAKAHGVDFQVLFNTPTEEWFIGDQMRMSQILTNLLSNAVKFTSLGGRVRLNISQIQTLEKTARMRFEVSDTGIGMSESFLNNIWTPFEQADTSISRRFGGTGLGLSITKNLVDFMNGTIKVESRIDVGSTFTVELDLERMAQPERESGRDFSGVNVLVADGDDSTCEYLKLLFDRFGVKCTMVTSGREAIDAIAQGVKNLDRYNVCVVDWNIDGNEGAQMIRRIRDLSKPDIPVIIVSSYDLSEAEAQARDAGADSLVEKPFFQSTVVDILAGIDGKRRQYAHTKGADLGGARVMLAEDNKMNMDIAKAILSSWNLKVDQAWNGQEAVDMLLSSPRGTYKAILMDVHMPEMDGYRATRMIRSSSHPDASTVPIIAMTADVFAEDVAAATAAGMNGHIGKPIDKALLLDTLSMYISPKET